MSAERKTRASKRYLDLDSHKHYCVVAGVVREGRVLLQPVRVDCRFAACRPGRVAKETSVFLGSSGH